MKKEELRKRLYRIDRRGYKAYKDIEGSYDFDDFKLSIDHAQADPFASPSRVRIILSLKDAGFPQDFLAPRIRRIALQDYLSREFKTSIMTIAKGRRGTGKGGLIDIDAGGQEILERTAVVIDNGEGDRPSVLKELSLFLEARITVGLPALGRRIISKEAEEIFFNEIPSITKKSLFYQSLDREKLRAFIYAAEDQEYLRGELKKEGLVSFIPDGAILPRISGVDERPLKESIPFKSPPSLEKGFILHNKGEIKGMGIPEGVTLIVGGGFHGKTTLLDAIEKGVYNHILGDGREYAVTVHEAVKIRAEDGRNIEKVDISPFIQNLPLGKDTKRFSTENASGSTSQAANIIEALEVGAKVLLIDEDTSATNFMIRDMRMQELVSKDKEPITPFLDKVRHLYKELGVSTILVMGGSGEYFDVADTVIMMDEYRPKDVTTMARKIAETHKGERRQEGGATFGEITPRRPLLESFDPSHGKREVKIGAKGLKEIIFGRTVVDLSYLEQLVDPSQTRAIGEIIYYYSKKYAPKGLSLAEGLGYVMDDLKERGLDLLSYFKIGALAMPRIYEIVGAINRMRSLKIK
jgi:predicted ABC-class ATPase